VAAGSRFQDFLHLAVDKEISAALLYEKYANLVSSSSSRKLLTDMALMERGHEKKLKNFLKTGSAYFSKIGVIENLYVSDFMSQPVLNESSPIEDVFVFAMKEEQKAVDMYSRLGNLETDNIVKDLFKALADEEKKHKHDLEAEYEKGFQQEN
jgi:rubrerythrin